MSVVSTCTVDDPDDPDCLPGGGPGEDFWPKLWLRVGIVLVLAGQGMAFGLGLNTADPPLTPKSPIYWVLHGGLLLSAVVALVLLGGPLLRETWANLCRARITVESLFTLSVLGAFAGSLLSTIRGHGSVYYEVVAIVLAIYTVGKALGVRGKARALAEARKLEADLDFAVVEEADELRRMPVEQVTVNHLVVVAPGEVIPVDGIVLRGSAYVQEQPLTGEPAPVTRGPGDSVLAGTHSVDGTLFIKAERLKGQRRFDEVLAAVREAREKPSRLQREADQLTRWFVPAVCTVSVSTFIGWLPFVGWAQALFNAMAVLIVACPCALGLATPAAVWAGLATLARLGLVARQGDILEDLARARTFVFDKTGTLSREHLTVTEAELDGPWQQSPAEIAAGLLAIETPLSHPAAVALRAWASEGRGASPGRPPMLLESHLVPAQGIKAVLEIADGHTQHWRIGQKAFALGEQPSALDSHLWVSINKDPAARFTLAETLRAGAEGALHDLKSLGVAIDILSGDPAPGWTDIAGVSIASGLTPTEKVAQVKALRVEAGPLVFVGDGVNDAPAMAEADAAIALDSGAGLSQATAGAVLLGGQLSGLPQAVTFARKLTRALRGNLRFALCYNLLGMGLAAGGILHPVVAALLMLGSSAIVSGRVLRVAGGVERT